MKSDSWMLEQLARLAEREASKLYCWPTFRLPVLEVTGANKPLGR